MVPDFPDFADKRYMSAAVALDDEETEAGTVTFNKGPDSAATCSWILSLASTEAARLIRFAD
jgi:hypothetical protein